MNIRHLRRSFVLAFTLLMLTGAVKNEPSIAQEIMKDDKVVTIVSDSKVVETKEVVDEWYIKEIPLTKEQQKYVVKVCKEYNFDPLLIYAVMKKESNFTIDCKSETSDFGIMQINSSNFEWLEEQLGKDLKFLTFEDNVLAGVYMLNQYREAWKYQYADDEKKHMIYMLNSYNMGVSKYKNYVKSRGGNYNSRLYAVDIMEYYKQFMLGNFK